MEGLTTFGKIFSTHAEDTAWDFVAHNAMHSTSPFTSNVINKPEVIS